MSRTRPNENEKEALGYDCPWCRAEPGTWCGAWYSPEAWGWLAYLHQRRYRAARSLPVEYRDVVSPSSTQADAEWVCHECLVGNHLRTKDPFCPCCRRKLKVRRKKRLREKICT